MADNRFNTLSGAAEITQIDLATVNAGPVDVQASLTNSTDPYGIFKAGLGTQTEIDTGAGTWDARAGIFAGTGLVGGMIGAEAEVSHSFDLGAGETLDVRVRAGVEQPFDYWEAGDTHGIAAYGMGCADYAYKDTTGEFFFRQADVNSCIGIYGGDIAGYMKGGVEMPLMEEQGLYGVFNARVALNGGEVSYGADAGVGLDFECPSLFSGGTGECKVEGGVTYQSDASGFALENGKANWRDESGVGGYARIKLSF